jgi:hypothetical protein
MLLLFEARMMRYDLVVEEAPEGFAEVLVLCGKERSGNHSPPVDSP